MRMTLSLDDDVAALIERIRKIRGASLKAVVNAALREGLVRMLKAPAPRKRFRTRVHSCGRCYLPNLDNTAEVLAMAEGEQFKIGRTDPKLR
jgi:hypothetical protein